ncbi:hypothetical protein HNQ64_000044 [Prosthecobacter dejongeii]|uniref:Uncharacterized protein n=1 Tax=Prosthecobacter dejongeii TaxID=48465 RepID=A0A7W8DN75_9BACT|nr:hypothetical protein [Prosthecobacter dejongeii]
MKHLPSAMERTRLACRVLRPRVPRLRDHAPRPPLCTSPKLTAGRRHTLNPSAFVRPRHRQSQSAPLHPDAKAQRDSITEFRETRNSARETRALHRVRRPKTAPKLTASRRQHGPLFLHSPVRHGPRGL